MKKKILLFLLVIFGLFTITGCGNNSEKYIGNWEYDTGRGNIITYHFIKGGTGYYEQSAMKDTKWDFTWEVKDDVLVTSRTAIGTIINVSFEMNSNNELVCISGDMGGPYIKK